jgi:hypothetical protein
LLVAEYNTFFVFPSLFKLGFRIENTDFSLEDQAELIQVVTLIKPVSSRHFNQLKTADQLQQVLLSKRHQTSIKLHLLKQRLHQQLLAFLLQEDIAFMLLPEHLYHLSLYKPRF